MLNEIKASKLFELYHRIKEPIEKPLSLEVREGGELAALAREKGRVLMVGHILQYHPAVIKLRELIDKGDVGKIQHVYSNRLNIGKIRSEENILWSFAPDRRDMRTNV